MHDDSELNSPNSPEPPVKYTDGISRHRVSPYTVYSVYYHYHTKHYIIIPHADKHVGDISVTIFLFVCFLSAGFLVMDICGMGWHRLMKFCRVVDLGRYQVISPFGDLWPRG